MTKKSRLDTALVRVYSAAAEELAGVMDVRNMYIALYDKHTGKIEFPLRYENGKQIDPKPYVEPRFVGDRKGLTDWVIEYKEPLLISRDFEAKTRRLGIQVYTDMSTKSWVGAPMLYGEDVIGVIGLNNFETEGAYDEFHRDLLATIAGQAAVAITNARLVQALIVAEQEKLETEAEKDRSESHRKRLDLFRRISDDMAQAGQNPDNILLHVARATNHTMNFMKCERISLFRFDHVTSRFTQGVEMFPDCDPRVIDEKSLTHIDAQLNEVAHGQMPFFGHDADASMQDPSLPLLTLNENGIPNTVGVLGVHFGVPRKLSLDDREILEHLAKQASIAIGYAEARTSAYANEQLAALGQAAATLQHRLSNTINITLPAIMRLRLRVGNDTTAMEILETVERNTNFATDVIRRMQIPLQKEDFILSDLNLLLHGAIKDCLTGSARFPSSKLATNLQELTTVISANPNASYEVLIEADFAEALPQTYVSPGRMTEVFRVLIDNGIRAVADANRSGTVSVTSRLKSDGPRPIIEVEVEDTGKGMRDEIKRKIFKQPVPRKQPERGSGLGLWLSNLIVKSHSGYIDMTSELSKGSSFRVSLPVLTRAPASGREDGTES